MIETDVRTFVRSVFVGLIFFGCLWALGVDFFKALAIGVILYFSMIYAIGTRWVEKTAFALLVYSLLFWINVAPAPSQIKGAIGEMATQISESVSTIRQGS